MAYKKPNSGSDEQVRSPMPKEIKREMFAIADQLLGASKIRIMCADGQSRMGRIRGKLKKRMWIREGDLLIIRPWEFQDEKADIVYRYTRTQASNLARRGVIPEEINIF
ncbi:MAG: translation initiation factor eIF-1A [Thermoplasmata archaeon]|nr:translation initiation factor eIF-1A [Thermoplasmata archaeon]